MKRAITGWRIAAGKLPVTLWLVAAVFSAQFAARRSPCRSFIASAARRQPPCAALGGALLLFVARPRLWIFGRRQLVGAAALGITTAGMSFFFFAAVGRIPLGTAVSIEFIGPLAVALAGIATAARSCLGSAGGPRRLAADAA